ncbi:MAG: dTDP-4-dehydrorhamnose 3,5-epimerase [Patescibacteria group bacterium]
MKFQATKIIGIYVIKGEPVKDGRGEFARIFCREELGKAGITFEVAQISRSFTRKRGTIRGLHFQRKSKEEDKIIACLQGAIFDVVLDLRKGSPTRGKWVCNELSENNQRMILVPKGCAHGFQTLQDNCEVLMITSEFYSPDHEQGVRWDDPLFGISWPLANPILSQKDRSWALFAKKEK